MRKLLVILAFASFSVASFAQAAETPSEKYSVATNSFWSNWFVQGNFAWTAFYSNEEKHEGFAKSPLKDFRRGLGFSVAVGKWFTPGIGLRTKLNAMTGKSVISTDADINKIKYWNLQEQALLNLSNLFCGYNPDRVWNISPYFGVGIARNCSYNTYEVVGSAGILNTWKLTDKLRFNLDLGYNLCGDDFEGMEYAWGRNLDAAHDRWFTAEVGLTLNLGKGTFNKVPDVDALKAMHQGQLDALNAQLADLQAENQNLRNREPEIKYVRDTINQSVHDFVTTPVSVFFDLAKINVANLKDLVNVQALAKYAKENNSNLLVTGYADSATGTPAINERLSMERAETVKNELIKMGISESKIRCTHNGGVNILGQKCPKEFDRRATVQIVD
jgi:outer membrane protein OmpA-like peptidoglycan-associated protein